MRSQPTEADQHEAQFPYLGPHWRPAGPHCDARSRRYVNDVRPRRDHRRLRDARDGSIPRRLRRLALLLPGPGGSFETRTQAWTLTGGATSTSGSGPLRLGAAARSLRLPAGATATSPVFCVDLNYPTFRFFSGRGNAPLSVDVIYPALGTKKPKATTVNGGTPAWSLTKDVSLRPTLVTKDAGWRMVQLRFIAGTGATGDWLVDDVLIDPRMR